MNLEGDITHLLKENSCDFKDKFFIFLFFFSFPQNFNKDNMEPGLNFYIRKSEAVDSPYFYLQKFPC